jgi:peptidoglycan-N-acetylmuramic acid deacetylase
MYIQQGNKKMAAALIFVLILLFCAGCGKKQAQHPSQDAEDMTAMQEEESKEEETTLPQITIEEAGQYDNTVVTWGPGVQMGEDGRPIACVAFQEKYKDLQTEFLKENEPVVYLTFDEGYENGYTAKILDILKEKNVHAVFFVTGAYAKEQNELLKRMVAEGHEIGNHSVSHPSGGMPSLTMEQQLQEMEELQNYVEEVCQYKMYLFRPPAGIFSEQSLAVTASFGYRTVMWSFAYADWDPDNQPSTADALNKMEGRLHNGAIYLLHAVSATNTAVLGEFIDYVRAQGYEFADYK